MISCSICGEKIEVEEEFIGHVEYQLKQVFDPEAATFVEVVEQTLEMMYMHKSCLQE